MGYVKCKVCGSTSDSTISFHRLPKTPERKSTWLEILNLHSDIDKNSLICSKHFKKRDYNRTRLKKNVIPKRLNYDENGEVQDRNSVTKSFTTNVTCKQIRPQLVNITNNCQVIMGPEMKQPNLPIKPNLSRTHHLTNSPLQNEEVQEGITITYPHVRIEHDEGNPSRFKINKGPQSTTSLTSNHIHTFRQTSMKEDNQPPKVTTPIHHLAPPLHSQNQINPPLQNRIAQEDTNNGFFGDSTCVGLTTFVNSLHQIMSPPPQVETTTMNADLRHKIRLRRLQRTLKCQQKTIQRLKAKFKNVKTRTTVNSILTKAFEKEPGMAELMRSQFQRSKNQKLKRKNYSSMEKTIGLTLYYSCGPNGYRTLLNIGLKLPALSTIRSWIKIFDLAAGLNREILDCLKDRVSDMKDGEKDCVIMWDEVSIKEYLEYSKNKDCFIGILDHGEGRRKLELANEALVVMIRGIQGNWKFPISYYFSNSNTTSEDLDHIIKENIKAIKEVGLRIRIGVCDMSFTNQGLYRKWGVKESHPYISYMNSKIYMVHDSPHLIKLVRNSLQKRNFLVRGMKVKWYWIQRFWQLDCRQISRMAPRLTKFHFFLKDFSKMKVRLATQVFSHSVYAGMKTMIRLKLLRDDAQETAKFVKEMDEMFDLLNISNLHESKRNKSAYFLFDNVHLFDKYCKLLRDIVVPGSKGAGPDCLRGLRLTLSGIKFLVLDLKTEHYSFVLTRRIQQDCLEHFFSFIRMRGGWNKNPTAQQFRYNFRYQFITHMVKSPLGSNCEYIKEDVLFTNIKKLQSFFKRSKVTEPILTKQKGSELLTSSEGLQSSTMSCPVFYTLPSMKSKKSSDIQESNVTIYMANACCRTLAKSLNCRLCKALFTKSEMVREEGSILSMFKKYTSSEQYSDTVLINTLPQSVCDVFQTISKDFEIVLQTCLNVQGVNVLSSIETKVTNREIVNAWIHSSVECHKHRLKMIRHFLLAKIFRLVKDKNEEVKQSKSWDQTRRDLRNQ